MDQPSEPKSKYLRLIIFYSVLKIFIHILANENYGFHADELYYIALSKHLQWGYLDNSPFIAFITRISRLFIGTSLFAYRILPTIFSGLTVLLVGLATRRFGGRSLAISIACLGIICSPAFLATSYFLQPVVFDQFFWLLCAYLLLRYFQTKNPINLYLFGITCGFGILNKYTYIIYLLALIASIFLTKIRRQLVLKDLLISLLSLLLIIFPNLLWQINHHFPIFNYLKIVKESAPFNGLGIYLFQFLLFHGAGIAIWSAGLIFMFHNRYLKKYLFVAFAFIITTGALLVLQGKIYYGLGAFPILFAVGGVCWESSLSRFLAGFRYFFILLIILPTLIAAPLVVPILPLKLCLRYIQLMRDYTSVSGPLIWDDGKVHQLPLFYADMIGWEILEKNVSFIYQNLPAEERKNMVILTDDYKVAGSLSYYKTNDQISIISPSNSFISWSPVILHHQTVIYITNQEIKEVTKLAASVRLMGIYNQRLSSINGMKIYKLIQPTIKLRKLYSAERERFLN